MKGSKACPECKSKNIELKNGEELCRKCGLVLSERFYSGDGRAF